MHHDRREQSEGGFRTLLLKWLGSLPSEGWEGTSHEAGEELAAFDKRHGLYAYVPISAGKTVAGLTAFLTANGFTLTHHRTKQARTLRVTRIPAGDRP
jgi:hypothetical protein